jgi:hypothetical protein
MEVVCFMVVILFLPCGATAPSGPGPPHYRYFTIALRHITLSTTPLDEWSARHRDLYLTTNNNLKKQTSMPPWDSNPQSQQANGRRPTPYAAQPLESSSTTTSLDNNWTGNWMDLRGGHKSVEDYILFPCRGSKEHSVVQAMVRLLYRPNCPSSTEGRKEI